MEIPGICSVCKREAKPAYTCILCGATVCTTHFLPEKGICKKCSFRAVG